MDAVGVFVCNANSQRGDVFNPLVCTCRQSLYRLHSEAEVGWVLRSSCAPCFVVGPHSAVLPVACRLRLFCRPKNVVALLAVRIGAVFFFGYFTLSLALTLFLVVHSALLCYIASSIISARPLLAVNSKIGVVQCCETKGKEMGAERERPLKAKNQVFTMCSAR